MKISTIIICAYLLFNALTIGYSVSAQPYEWVVDGGTVYIDDPFIYASATPHTITSDGFVTFELISKSFEGAIDVVFGFDDNIITTSQPQIWRNYTHELTRVEQVEKWGTKIFYGVTNITNLGIENYNNIAVNIGNENNTYLYEFDSNIYDNIVVAFTDYEINGNDYTLSGNYETYETIEYEETYFDWQPLSNIWQTVEYDFGGMTTWHVLQNINVTANTLYSLRLYIDIPFTGLETYSSKYWFAFKPSSETISEAIGNGHLYYLDPWFDSSWNYLRTLTIDSSYVNNTLVNFPVLVIINSEIASKCDGGDSLRFYAGKNSGGTDNITQYAHEVELWNESGNSYVWVNVTEIYSDSDTIFNMYYNNSDATDDQNPTGVWDENFIGVWHLNEPEYANQNDSTTNNHDANQYCDGTNQNEMTGGIVADCIEFGDGNDYYMTDSTSDFNTHPDNPLTFSLWIKVDNVHSYEEWGGKYYDYHFMTRTDPYNSAHFYTGADGQVVAINSDEWTYLVGSYNGGNTIYYKNGDYVNDYPRTITDSYGDQIGIGHAITGGRQPDGWLDEVRVSNTKRNATWVYVSYHSMINTSGFMTISDEMVPPPADPTLIYSDPTPTNESEANPTISYVGATISGGDYFAVTIYLSDDATTFTTWHELNNVSGSFAVTMHNKTFHLDTPYYWYIDAEEIGNVTNTGESDIYTFTTTENVNATASSVAVTEIGEIEFYLALMIVIVFAFLVLAEYREDVVYYGLCAFLSLPLGVIMLYQATVQGVLHNWFGLVFIFLAIYCSVLVIANALKMRKKKQENE